MSHSLWCSVVLPAHLALNRGSDTGLIKKGCAKMELAPILGNALAQFCYRLSQVCAGCGVLTANKCGLESFLRKRKPFPVRGFIHVLTSHTFQEQRYESVWGSKERCYPGNYTVVFSMFSRPCTPLFDLLQHKYKELWMEQQRALTAAQRVEKKKVITFQQRFPLLGTALLPGITPHCPTP